MTAKERRDTIARQICPECGSTCYWNTIGQDNCGEIKELTCLGCTWCESEEDEHMNYDTSSVEDEE